MNESFLALKATRNKVDPPREYQSPAEFSYLLQGDRSSEFLFLFLSTIMKTGPGFGGWSSHCLRSVAIWSECDHCMSLSVSRLQQ